MGKISETFWKASTHFLINAWLKTGGMLPNYVLGVTKNPIEEGRDVINIEWIDSP